jgi:hypothetical protein
MPALKLLVVLGVSSFTLFAQQPLRLQRLEGAVTLDGHSAEPAWQNVQPLPLVMHSPTHRGPMSQPTEIRVAYDDNYIYAAARFYVTDPSIIQANSLTRDGISPSEDSFGLVLDSFNDNENALAFLTNPEGLREDWAVFGDAEAGGGLPFNSSWNTFWDVATVRTNEGWFAEMRIPFSSLRFQDDRGRVVMGMIVWRYIPRLNEVYTFPDIPPKWDWSIIKPSVAQKVLFEEVFSRNPLYITPYALGGAGFSHDLNDTETSYLRTTTRKQEVGLDLKYSITSNLTLDVTLNTDFAQVEADDQQVNLTRFSLFFPEKRLFFQERASIFDFSTGGPNRLFYSRRIGLSDDGPVRIYGGLRLVGRVGSWDVGLLNMQTERTSDLPSENFGVLRLRRQVLNEHSTLGAIVTSRRGGDGSSNIVYGLDATLRLFGDDYLVLNWAQTFDGEFMKRSAVTLANTARGRVQWEKRTNEGFGYEASLSYAGPDYDPTLGFAPRVNYTRFGDRIFYGWKPGEGSEFYSHVIGLSGSAFTNNDDGRVESADVGPDWTFRFRSGGFGRVALRMYRELLEEDFELSSAAFVPAGRYTFYGVNGFYQTPWGRSLRSGFNVDAGSFYDGTRLSAGVSPTWSISRHLELSGEYQLNRVRFDSRKQEFNAHIARVRVKVNVSTEVSATAFAQYNSAANGVILNFRLRYNPREGSDLYIVYNEGLNIDRFRESPVRPATDTRTVLLKYTYTFVR